MFGSEHLLSILNDLLPCHRGADSEILEFFAKTPAPICGLRDALQQAMRILLQGLDRFVSQGRVSYIASFDQLPEPNRAHQASLLAKRLKRSSELTTHKMRNHNPGSSRSLRSS